MPFAIATSSAQKVAAVGLALLELPAYVPVVTRDLVERAKPDPHLFLAAAERLRIDPARAFVVGDSIWDLLAAQRAGALGIGLLSGGYGPEELQAAGAYRVYQDPADLLGPPGGSRGAPRQLTTGPIVPAVPLVPAVHLSTGCAQRPGCHGPTSSFPHRDRAFPHPRRRTSAHGDARPPGDRPSPRRATTCLPCGPRTCS